MERLKPRLLSRFAVFEIKPYTTEDRINGQNRAGCTKVFTSDEVNTYVGHSMLARLNYWITVFTLLNLVIVTLSVWLFPKVWIFRITSTLAWILIMLQYIVAHRLHRVGTRR